MRECDYRRMHHDAIRRSSSEGLHTPFRMEKQTVTQHKCNHFGVGHNGWA